MIIKIKAILATVGILAAALIGAVLSKNSRLKKDIKIRDILHKKNSKIKKEQLKVTKENWRDKI